ncbi:MAG TPA: DUF5666 domain-containing protein [Capillimicrobium sp.]|nr:DUF5666 domain-containing protein [Capillimicrobium sp.]
MRRAGAALAAVVIALLLATLAPSVAGAKADDGLRSFHGRVVSTSSDAFKIRRGDGTKMRFAVTGATRFERIGGLAALRRGMAIEVKGVRADGGWVARKVEREDDDDAGDDHGGHGDDDPPGDDHGGDDD